MNVTFKQKITVHSEILIPQFLQTSALLVLITSKQMHVQTLMMPEKLSTGLVVVTQCSPISVISITPGLHGGGGGGGGVLAPPC